MPLCHQLDSNLLVPSAVLAASFVGSGHCVGMCGGLVVAVSRSTAGIVLYHLGRLVGYLALGLLFGLIGERVNFLQSDAVSITFALVMGASLILLGLFNWREGRMHLPMPAFITERCVQWSGNCLDQSTRSQINIYPAVIGLLSIFLPCGWLYAFVLGALSTQSAWKGTLFMFLFWLGTLPALTITPWIFNTLFKRFPRLTPRLSAAILICIGIITIVLKFI